MLWTFVRVSLVVPSGTERRKIMSERITMKHIEFQLQALNGYFGIKDAKWDTVGHFYVDQSNGGYRLVRVINEGGGCTDISFRGTKREIYDSLYAINNVLVATILHR